MSGINKVILVGHLGKDPEVRHLDGGVTVASFPLATSETYNKDGRKIEQTEWHNIVMWRGLADIASKYLQKGKLVYIEGKLRTRSFEDKEGHKKYTTEVVAENFTMLGRKSDFEGPGENSQQKSDDEHGTGHSNPVIAKEDQPMNYEKRTDDDLPF
jgi:single-strand DNA-binding protein